MVKIVVFVALGLHPAPIGAQPAAPPDPRSVVPKHVQAVSDHLARATSSDDVGRVLIVDARLSVAAARSALGTHSFRAADEWAASADDLLRAAQPGDDSPQRDVAGVLANVEVVEAALAGVPGHRVRDLLGLARTVAGEARRDAALDKPGAGREAGRAEAIARAAAHVAIATDASLAPILPPPPPPKPPAPAPP